MKTALIVLLCLCLIPYAMAFVSGYLRQKQLGKIDNQNPREQYSKLQGIGARAVAAQQNSWEALGIYTAALVAVIGAGVTVENLAEVAMVVLAARILHAIFYLTNLDKLRSLSFFIMITACCYLFYMAISGL